MLHRRRADQQSQAPAALGRQLQPPEGATVEPFRPRQNRCHARTAKRLVQGPVVVGLTGGTNENEVLQFDSQANGRGRVKLAAAIQHHQRPAVATRSTCGPEGQRGRSGTLTISQPLGQRASAEPPIGQQLIQRTTTARYVCRVITPPGLLKLGNLLP